MNLTPKISIIVPVYNAEKYLQSCIDSILNQTFLDFELLLIDDGSKDTSLEICDKYAKNDKRVKTFHQKNQGVSATRNRGIEIAVGEYVCFVDSDDWIEVNFLEKLFEHSEFADLNILTGLAYDYPNKTICRNPNYSQKKYLKKEIINLLIENNFFTIGDGGSCSKLFRKNILANNNVKFIDNNAAYEDTLFTFEYLSKCEKVSIAKGSHYHYMHRDTGSLSTKKHPYQNYIDSGKKGLALLFEIQNKYQIEDDSTFIIKGITKFIDMLNYSVYSLYSNIKQTPKTERIKLLHFLSEQNSTYKKHYKPYSLKQKIVHYIIRFRTKSFSDILLILLFKISTTIKSN